MATKGGGLAEFKQAVKATTHKDTTVGDIQTQLGMNMPKDELEETDALEFDITAFTLSKFSIQKKIYFYNKIDIMNRRDLKILYAKWTFHNNYLSFGTKEIQKPTEITADTVINSSSGAIINVKRIIMMNIITDIIVQDIKPMFISQAKLAKLEFRVKGDETKDPLFRTINNIFFKSNVPIQVIDLEQGWNNFCNLILQIANAQYINNRPDINDDEMIDYTIINRAINRLKETANADKKYLSSFQCIETLLAKFLYILFQYKQYIIYKYDTYKIPSKIILLNTFINTDAIEIEYNKTKGISGDYNDFFFGEPSAQSNV